MYLIYKAVFESMEQERVMPDFVSKFVCERCHHESSCKGNLIKHLNKKNACPATHSNVSREDVVKNLTRASVKPKTFHCDFCDKAFSTSQGRCQHKKTCSKHPDKEVKVMLVIMQKRIEELEYELKRQKNGSNATIVNNTNNIQNQQIINNTIVINNFGNENTGYITPELLTYCLSNPKKGISYLIEQIHYNKDYPENHNLRCKSLKNNVFERFVNAQWTRCDASNTLDELIKKGYRILEAHFAETFLSDPGFFDDQDKVENMQRFRQVLTDKTSNEYHSVKRDLRLLVKDKTMYLLEFVEPMDDNATITRSLM